MFLDELCKRLVTTLLSLENPGKFVVHSRSLYFLYAKRGKRSRPTLALPKIRQIDPQCALYRESRADFGRVPANAGRRGHSSPKEIPRPRAVRMASPLISTRLGAAKASSKETSTIFPACNATIRSNSPRAAKWTAA